MKKLKILAVIVCAGFIMTAVSCSIPSRGDETPEIGSIDVTNATNISRYEQIPIVSDEILASGRSGGEGGQWPLCLTGDNNDGNLMFYGTNVGGLYRSTDGGKSWHKSMKDMLTHGVCDVEIDPNNEERVVCFGTDGSTTNYTTGVYLSTDSGESWNFMQNFPIGGDRDIDESIAYDPTSYSKDLGGSAVLYLSLVEKKDVLNPTLLTDETRGLYRSDDGGRSWNRINAALGDGIVKVAPSGRVYVGTDSGLFMSADRGKNFSQVLDTAVTGLDVVGDAAYVLTDFKDGENSYVKVYKHDGSDLDLISDLTGENVDLVNLEWQKFYVAAGNDLKCDYHFSPSVHKAYSLKVSPVDTNNMALAYCNSNYGAGEYYTFASMYSVDGGKSWHSSVRDNERENLGITDYNFLPYNTRKMDFYWSPTDKNKVWDFENDYLSSSDDCGKTFLWDSNGINGICVGGFFGMNIFDSDLVYFGAQDYNGAFTVNGGKSWKYVDAGKNSWGGHVYGGYAASKDVIFGSQSESWTGDRYLAISYDGGKTVVNHLNDPNYKINAGYKNRLNNQSNNVGYQAFNDRNVLFCGDLRSADMGKTWHRMSGVTRVYTHDSENGYLYGVDDNARNVVFSSDNGLNWQVLVSALDLNKYWDEMYISDVAVDSKNKFVYVTSDWSKLYKINISTKEVEDLTSNVPEGFKKESMPDTDKIKGYFARRLTTVAVDRNYPEIVYVGGSAYGYQTDSGLFRSCDGGKTFYTLTSNSTTSIVKSGEQGGFEPTCIRVNSDGDLWIAGNCLGLCKINAPYEIKKTRGAASI